MEERSIDGKSMGSYQQSDLSKKKKDKKAKKDGEDEDGKATMDKKKMKVLKDALKDFKSK